MLLATEERLYSMGRKERAVLASEMSCNAGSRSCQIGCSRQEGASKGR